MRAADVMTEDPVWVDAMTTLGEAGIKLDRMIIRHLPVLSDGVPVGILSDRDLRSALPPLSDLREQPARFLARLDAPVSEAMTTRVAAVDPDRDLKDVVDLMLEQQLGAVLVTDPVGSQPVPCLTSRNPMAADRSAYGGPRPSGFGDV